MNYTNKISYRVILFIGFSGIFFFGFSKKSNPVTEPILWSHEKEATTLKPLQTAIEPVKEIIASISPVVDSPDIELKYPYRKSTDPNQPKNSIVNLKEPLNIKRKIRYNAKTGKYEFISTIGDSNEYQRPSYMTLEEYRKYEQDKAEDDYWKQKIAEDNSTNSGDFAPQLARKNREFGDICEGKLIDIQPQGTADLKFGLNTTRTDNPAIPVKQRQLTTFDFDQQIQLNVTGSICDKFKLNFNYNTEATFDFENQTKLAYEGNEDQILQKIEAGNVTFPVPNSLIQGSQSLFGIRTDLRFGKLNISTVLSQNRGERKEINIKNGAQQKEYELPINSYEENKHYFLNHYHRDNFDRAMSSLPNVSSQVRITKIEVWVTNRVNDVDETRNIVAFSDLGETRVLEGNPTINTGNPNGIPKNDANSLYDYLDNTPGTRNLTTTS
ncbi:MAG: cell surface protein SprA, partial [Flavobacteriales bacterium]